MVRVLGGTGRCIVENATSALIMEKVRMTHEGTLM
jgi:hypothetical protein